VRVGEGGLHLSSDRLSEDESARGQQSPSCCHDESCRGEDLPRARLGGDESSRPAHCRGVHPDAPPSCASEKVGGAGA